MSAKHSIDDDNNGWQVSKRKIDFQSEGLRVVGNLFVPHNPTTESNQAVNKERIEACGISMGGGYMLQLAAFDRRIKAVSIVASGLNLGDTSLEMLGKEGLQIS